jgi:hypothetical protein
MPALLYWFAHGLLPIRDGLLVGKETFTRYDAGPEDCTDIPVTTTQSSQINAEYVYRGSTGQ